ncbi:MAG: 30S ribosomal protein S4 [bacterium]|nr:30S ribosomal protein S4 [bacterium]
MRYTGPKNRISRREQVDLGLKTPGTKAHATLLRRLNIPPGQHGAKRRRKESEHSRQLREKQKIQYLFGTSEKQLKKYFDVASRKKGNTGVYLCELLERRLDNIVYRLGLTPTRAAARQLVNHGNVHVDGKKLSSPSYQVKTGSEVTYGSKAAKEIPYIQEFRENNEVVIPEWLTLKKETGTLTGIPDNSLIGQQVNLRLVIEYYSR